MVLLKFELRPASSEYDRLEVQVLDTTGRALCPVLSAGVVGDDGVAPTSVLLEWSDYLKFNSRALFEFGSPHLFAGDVLRTVYMTCAPGTTYMLQWRFFRPGEDFIGWASAPLSPVPEPAVPGDLNGDGVVNAADIDLEFAAINGGQTDAKYDLDGIGGVGQGDADHLVRTILHSQYGDANLSRTVDADDYTVWFNNIGNTAAGWTQADFNGSMTVDADDYVQWFNNIGFSYSGSSESVPEPMTLSLLALGGLAFLRRKTATSAL